MMTRRDCWRWRDRWGALLLCVFWALPAAAGTFEEDCAAARARRPAALIELATWCHDNKLYATRNELAEQILQDDPSESQAHRWLKHRLGAGGEWEVPTTPARATDRNDVARAQLPVVRGRIMGEVARALFDALETHDETVSPGEREVLLGELVALVPSKSMYRDLHGEVKTADGWVLVETESGRERLPDLREAATRALAAIDDPKSVSVPAALARSGIRWTGAYRTADVFVATTASETEAKTIARDIQAAPEYLRAAFGSSQRVRSGAAIHVLLGGTDEAVKLYAVHPDATDEDRAKVTRFGGMWIGKTAGYASYAPSSTYRVESSVATQTSWELIQSFGLTRSESPFAFAGFVKRLTYDLVGTRITVTRRVSEYADDAAPWATWGELTNADWYSRALEVLRDAGPADLVEMFGRPMNLITIRDEVVANALAAYYLEGRPNECRAFLQALGSGASVSTAIEQASRLDVVALRMRMVRWLEERRD